MGEISKGFPIYQHKLNIFKITQKFYNDLGNYVCLVEVKQEYSDLWYIVTIERIKPVLKVHKFKTDCLWVI